MPEPTDNGQQTNGEQPNAAANGNGTQGNNDPNAAASNDAFDFAAWLSEQPDHVQAGFESHTAGLKSALQKERDERKAERNGLTNQIRDLQPKAEKGSEMEKALADALASASQAEKRAAFFEEAGKPEIGCVNAKAAFLIAQADDLFDKRGEPDWTAIKASAPELFGRKPPPGNAGSGNGSPPPRGGSMNDFIRRAAGRG